MIRIEYTGLTEIRGPLVTLGGVTDVGYDELAELTLRDGGRRLARVIGVDADRVVLQVFEGTDGLSLDGARAHFRGGPLTLPLSRDILGRTFTGAGAPVDGLGEVWAVERRDINGAPMNPVCRLYPQKPILTGVSAIDGMATLIRGQKLPIFSGDGLRHNELAAQIARQARVPDGEGDFVVVFCAMGVKNDTAAYFLDDFAAGGALSRCVTFMNLASDPIVERILAPRCAMTAAEYLAFTLGFHVLVVMTDMTSYCEALREFSSSKGEIPSRKGYPSYMYSDLASIYERAGILRGVAGSVTLLPILTMPSDDISHPIPDLTGYITEGQIVLSRELAGRGIYPPVGVLPSLSRIMKDGVGPGRTREDHAELSNQLFAAYSAVMDARSLASVIGEDELSPTDKRYLAFGEAFENAFIRQGEDEERSMEQTLDIGWRALGLLPREELSRVSGRTLEKYWKEAV